MSTANVVNAFVNLMGSQPRETSEPAAPGRFASDIPYSLAHDAHRGTSMSPERRAASLRAEYSATLESIYAELLAHANTPDKLATLDEEFERLRSGYRKRYGALLSSQSRVMSTMIAGPSNFPVRMMEKRNRVVDGRRTELLEFLPRAKAAILKKLHPEWRPIMAGDSNATERLEEKIATAEAVQERMKAANAAIRKHKKAGPAAQVAALVALGIKEAQATLLLQPDFCGRIGFASFELTNNNANIARMKERLAKVSANKAAESSEVEGENARIEDCPADNRVRLFFAGKPPDDIRTDLKRSGFRWSPTIGCWQAYRNSGTIAKARAVAGLER